jgi:hypothetical protein
MKIVDQSVKCEMTGETEVLGENLSQCHIIDHKSHMIWPGLEPGPPRWEAEVLVLNFVQIECDLNTIPALVMYGEQKYGRYMYKLQEFWYWWQDIFNDLENVLLNGQHLIALREMFAFLGICGQQKEDLTRSDYINSSLYLLAASAAFALHSPQNRAHIHTLIQQMNSGITSITCFLQLAVLQTDWSCSTRVCSTALQHCVHGARLALYISTQSSASNGHQDLHATQTKWM